MRNIKNKFKVLIYLPWIIAAFIYGMYLHIKHKKIRENTPIVEPKELSEEEKRRYKKEVKKINDILEKKSLPIINITAHIEKPKSILESRYGGNPYWPKNMPYPYDVYNKPMRLLAQFNFEEIPHMSNYPDKGILQFFISASDESNLGLNFPKGTDNYAEKYLNANIKQDNFRVIYHSELIKSPVNLLTEFPRLSEDDYLTFPMRDEYSLSFKKSYDKPSPENHYFVEYTNIDFIEIETNLADYLFEHFYSGGSKLGGYANFTQDDPTRNLAEPWTLLFQMDTEYSDDGVDIMWGDSGIGNFFILPTDLKNRDFSKVFYNWDCH